MASDLQGKRPGAVDDDALGHDDAHQFILDQLDSRSALLQGNTTGAGRAGRAGRRRGAGGGGVLVGILHGSGVVVDLWLNGLVGCWEGGRFVKKRERVCVIFQWGQGRPGIYIDGFKMRDLFSIQVQLVLLSKTC